MVSLPHSNYKFQMDRAKITALTYRPQDENRDRMLSSPLQRAMKESKKSSAYPIPIRSSPQASATCPLSCPPNSHLLALPLELIHQICRHLSLETLSHFLTLSRRTSLAVTTHGAYSTIQTHLRPLISVLRLTHLLSFFSFSHLLSALYTSECVHCGHATESLFLPSLKRSCYACIAGAIRLMPMKPAGVKKWYGLRRKDLIGVPQMRTLVGTYHWDHNGLDEWVFNRAILMDQDLVHRRALELGKFRDVSSVSTLPYTCSPRRSLSSMLFPSVDQQTGEENICVRCAGCREVQKEAVDDMLDRGVESGYLNFRGEAEDDIWALYVPLSWYYTEKGWLAHFEECKKSQEMWGKINESGVSCKA
ncbi:MAG: hypothetical protein Q9187_004892 [Circinaria calcarea]